MTGIADPGARCLPAIMLNATDGYLPSAAGTGVVLARLSDGRWLRIRAALVGGRRYMALALPAGLTVTRVPRYDQAGRALRGGGGGALSSAV